MADRTFTDHEKADLESLMEQILDITGSSLDGNLPPALYDGIRRYQQTYCVDGVPVLEDELAVVLSKRGDGAVLPGYMWVVGGRVNKGEKYELNTLAQKAQSELGLESALFVDDLVGHGRLLMEENSAENRKDYAINTPTLLYAIRVPTSALNELKSGDGNENWEIYSIDRLIDEFEDLHPYVVAGALIAIDRVHGTEWREDLPPEMRNIGYPKNSLEMVRSSLMPLRLDYGPYGQEA